MALSTDFLVLGSGIAGLTFALRAAEFGEVLLVTKRECDDAATNWAQGGVAAVLGQIPADSIDQHLARRFFKRRESRLLNSHERDGCNPRSQRTIGLELPCDLVSYTQNLIR